MFMDLNIVINNYCFQVENKFQLLVDIKKDHQNGELLVYKAQ